MTSLGGRVPKDGAVYVWHCECGAHYTGFTTDVERRTLDHLRGDHPLMLKHMQMGHRWSLARIWWQASDLLEWRLKHIYKHTRRVCPLCSGSAAFSHFPESTLASQIEGWLREPNPWRMKNRGPSSRVHGYWLQQQP